MILEPQTTETLPSPRLEYLEGSGIYILRLGSPDEKVVTLTEKRLAAFEAALQSIGAEKPKGLVLCGPGPDMFTAGADISAIQNVTDSNLGEHLARRGQEIFNKLASLPFPVVAAISGPCVGGGCEMVLACDYRIISEQKSSVIGLPEVKLGILPGFGGTQRLPRLIGLPKALDIILQGRTLRPRQALACGLVDEVVSYHRLEERAQDFVARGKRTSSKAGLLDRFLTFTTFGRNFVAKKAKASVAKETKGFYPAPIAALDAAILGLEKGLDTGLKSEAKELGRLIVTPESKSLVRLFFLSEASKAIGKSGRRDAEKVYAVVVGAGVMGAGIAGLLARNESTVILKDTTEEALEKGVKTIRSYLERLKYLTEAERSFIFNRVEATTRDSPNIGNANFAVEAIFEDLNIKKKVLKELSERMPEDALIATNTSSLSVTEIASEISHPERVIGMHFFNPVDKMPLVEIIRAKQTGDKAIAVVAALSSKLGKFPIVVKDVPGFLVNRILVPYLNEAAFLLQEGYSVPDIDRAATSFGMPMGPLRLLDEVGLDVAVHVSEVMVKGYGERMRGPGFAGALVQAGRKGKKSGAGFYDFKNGETLPHPELNRLLNIQVPIKTVSDYAPLTERLIMALLNEAVRCFDEGVAGAPSVEAANQIDLGTVMGMGFPPFRGGLLHYADSLGAKQIQDKLSALEKTCGARFSPAEGIKKRALTKKSFSV